jgi:ABC-type multidrug transport system fused ATPase/permease subunit
MQIIESYNFFFKIITKKDKYYLFYLTIYSLFISILEFLTIAMLYPLILSFQGLDKNVDFFTKINLYFKKYLNLDLVNDQIISLVLILVVLFFLVFNLFNIHYLFRTGLFWSRIKAQIQQKVFIYYTEMNYLDLLNINNASVLKNINFEAKRFIDHFIAPIFIIISKIFVIIFLIAGIAYIEPKLTIYLLLLLIFYYSLIYNILKIIAKKNSHSLSEQYERTTKIIDETTNNFIFLKIFNLLGIYNLRLKESTDKMNKLEAVNNIISQIPRYVLETFFFLVGIFFIFFIFKENLFFFYLPVLILIFIVFLKIAPAFQMIYSLYISIKSHYSSGDSLADILLSKYYRKDLSDQSLKILTTQISIIDIKNLSFKYQNKTDYIINNLNLKFEKDSIYGIEGYSGSGKTTLINIIIGLISDYKGDVFINNINLKEISNVEWFSKIAIIPQNIFISEDTVLNNITLNNSILNSYDKDKLDFVLKRSGLSEFVNNLDQGINSLIVNNAKLISGGEKQRLAIARALYKEAQVLIFDEPVNNLDHSNIILFMKMLQEIKNEKIIIIIAHQKEVIANCDIIYKI